MFCTHVRIGDFDFVGDSLRLQKTLQTSVPKYFVVLTENRTIMFAAIPESRP